MFLREEGVECSKTNMLKPCGNSKPCSRTLYNSRSTNAANAHEIRSRRPRLALKSVPYVAPAPKIPTTAPISRTRVRTSMNRYRVGEIMLELTMGQGERLLLDHLASQIRVHYSPHILMCKIYQHGAFLVPQNPDVPLELLLPVGLTHCETSGSSKEPATFYASKSAVIFNFLYLVS